MNRTYLATVDGLRSGAVLSVLLYHAGISSFSGGFVGVDVFFVISGYLITANIVSDHRAGTFRFDKFYLRRARRLLPAAFFTLFACLIAGAALMSPAHMQELGGSAVYSVFSLSNVFFWMQADYWDAAAETKPLLHFWSLGVEEQFYVIWPALLIFLLGFKRQFFIYVSLAVLALASIWASEVFLDTHPNAVFYLTPFRAFEFCLGAALVWLPRSFDHRPLAKDATFLLGLALICIAVFTFTEEMRFPGVSAILPCLGAALIIFVAKAPGRFNLMLSNSTAVYIGKISYSVYLVHWPIIVFYKYWKFTDLETAEKYFLIALSICCGALMYHYIEQPFRRVSRPDLKTQNKHFLAALTGLAAFLVTSSASAWISGGWRGRYDEASLNLLSIEKNKITATYRSGICYTGSSDVMENFSFETCLTPSPHKTNIYLLGDSYAAHLYPGLRVQFPDWRILQANYSSCTAVIRKDRKPSACTLFTNHLYENFVTDNSVDAAILSGRWSNADLAPLRDTLRHLKAAGVTPIIIGRSAEYKKTIPEIVVRRNLKSGLEDLDEFLLPGLHQINAHLAQLAEEEGVLFFDALGAFCNVDGICAIADKLPDVYHWDNGHLTVSGSLYLAMQIKAALSVSKWNQTARRSE